MNKGNAFDSFSKYCMGILNDDCVYDFYNLKSTTKPDLYTKRNKHNFPNTIMIFFELYNIIH